jgi:sec-independent protein translocase protein TatB
MSLTEIALIMFVALILFGPEDLPVVARTLGKMMFQVRKLVNEIGKEFHEVIETPSNVINEALKDSPAKENTSQHEKQKTQNEELLSYEETDNKTISEIPPVETNPLAELPSEIILNPKDTQAGE